MTHPSCSPRVALVSSATLLILLGCGSTQDASPTATSSASSQETPSTLSASTTTPPASSPVDADASSDPGPGAGGVGPRPIPPIRPMPPTGGTAGAPQPNASSPSNGGSGNPDPAMSASTSDGGDGGNGGTFSETGGNGGQAPEPGGMGGELTAGMAGENAGGTGGQVTEPEPEPGNCPTNLQGWATIGGDGVNATTGGGDASPVRPTSAQEIMDLAADDQPRVIEIEGTFDIPRLQVASNKTLVGIGTDATINGGIRIRGYDDDNISNVIVRNLRVNGATTDVDSDAMQIYFAHHIWIDHCELWDGPDGNLDMTHAVNWVTVSWTKFRYTQNYQRPSGESSDHRFSSLIGHSDGNASEDDGRLKITFHHNWWAERVIERMPRVRYGEVHVYNNYYNSDDSNYCVRAGRNAHLLIESNYFDGVNSPHQFNNSEDEATAHITVNNNVYDDTSGDQATGGGGTPFTDPPYDANLDDPNDIPALVQECAGPR